jgi:hypothetical protein
MNRNTGKKRSILGLKPIAALDYPCWVTRHLEEITEKACSRALGAQRHLGATAAELLRVKRHKFPDAHRRPAGQSLDAVHLPVITTRPVQRAHRQKVPHQMLR